MARSHANRSGAKKGQDPFERQRRRAGKLSRAEARFELGGRQRRRIAIKAVSPARRTSGLRSSSASR